MNFTHIITISEARKRIFEIAETVQKSNQYYIATEKGKPKLVLLSASYFEALQDMVEALRIATGPVPSVLQPLLSGQPMEASVVMDALLKRGNGKKSLRPRLIRRGKQRSSK